MLDLHKYVKGAGLLMGASVILLCLNLLANPLIAMNMSPRDYAITGYYTSFNGLISPLIMFYLIGYYIKEYYHTNSEKRSELYAEVFNGLIFISCAISVICFAIILAYLYLIRRNIELPVFPYLALTVFSIPLNGIFALKLSKLRIEKKYTEYFKYSLIVGLAYLITTLILVAVLKMGAFGKLLAPFICNMVIFICLIYSNRTILKTRIKLSSYTQIFRFCFPLVLGAMLEYFSTGFTTTYMEGMGNITTYGIYVVGVSIGVYLTVLSSSISGVIQPDIYEATTTRNWKRLAILSLVEVAVIGIIIACFILLAPYIIHLLTAGRYDGATIYAQIASIAALSTTIFYRLNDFAIALNHQYFYFIATIIGSIVIILALNYATKRAGYIGGCWVQALANLSFGMVLALLLVFRNKKLFRVL